MDINFWITITRFLVGVFFAWKFIINTIRYIEVVSEMNVWHNLSVTDNIQFQALKESGEVVSSFHVNYRRRLAIFWALANSSLWIFISSGLYDYVVSGVLKLYA